MLKIVPFLLVFFGSLSAYSQVIYGKENFIQYNVGSLPIIISVPHGGNLTPSDIPDRTCNNPTTVTDANTIDLAQKIDSVFVSKTNCAPHIIYCNLKRTKLDANRNQSNGTCGHPKAVQAWNEFHKFIDTARYLVFQKYQNRAFYFDVHGHGNPLQRVELGYLLYDDELALDDATLNQPAYVENSSIQNLVKNNPNKLSHAMLLRGQTSFGSLLEKRSFAAVPSTMNPRPGIGNNYFSGGFNTANHTCYNPLLDINGIQVECNFQNLRDTQKNRIKFAEAFVTSVIEYMDEHFGLNLMECNPTTFTQNHEQKIPNIYPTVVNVNGILNLSNVNSGDKISMYDQNGRLVLQNDNLTKEIQLNENVVSGIYWLNLQSGKQNFTFKIIVID